VLEWEIHAHFDAAGQVVEYFDGFGHLGGRLDEGPFFLLDVGGGCYAVVLDAGEAGEVLFGTGETLCDVLLKQVHMWQIIFHPPKKVKNSNFHLFISP
jgi:hypothetical protein